MRRTNRACWLVAAALLWGCRGDEVHSAPEELTEGPPLIASRIVQRGPVGGGPDTELHRAQDIEPVGDSIAVVDNGNDRLVLLDGSLGPVWTSGREGEGPGEFEAPIAVRAWPAGMVVTDIGNARFTEVDRSGMHGRMLKGPHAAFSFGVRSDGAIVMPARSESHYAYVLTADGPPTPFAARDTAFDGLDMFGQPARPPYVAVTAGDTVHVFDETNLHLYKFGPSGEMLARRGLPRAFRDSLVTKKQAVVGSLTSSGYRVVGISMARTLKAMPDGRLLLLVSSGLTAGFVVDAHTYSVRRIVAPERVTEWAPLEKATSGILRGSRLTVLSEDSLFVYELRSGGS